MELGAEDDATEETGEENIVERIPGANNDGRINAKSFANEFQLNIPLGLTHRELSIDHEKGEIIDTILSPREKVLGLPGNLKLSLKDMNKYFGVHAKNQFYDRYQWVNKQRSINNLSNNEALSGLLFDNEEDLIDDKATVPFAPVRESTRYTALPSVISSSTITIESRNITDKPSVRFNRQTIQNPVKLTYDNDDDNATPAGKAAHGDISARDDTYLLDSVLPTRNNTKSPGSVEDEIDDNDSKVSNSTSYSLALQAHLAELDVNRAAAPTPRTKYLDECCKENLFPRSFLIRKNLTKTLDLQHQGMGDRVCQVLAAAVEELPFIQRINIADNNLTDAGLGPFINAIVKISGLLELNLSQNTLGPMTADSLSSYLSSSTCPLEKLVLNNADVDDFECERFISAIMHNRSITDLDLSYNKIGASENLNTVMPDMVTGSEALAELLQSDSCMIKKLVLQYNMIRLDGAVCLADSLSSNESLTYLDLSFNSFGTDGGMAIGNAIDKHKNLKTLIVSSNNIGSMACMSICAGILENKSLNHVSIDDNPIGVQGAKSLMMVPIIAGNRVKVQAKKCNITIHEEKCWFDSDKILRDYKLSMANPFERAIFSLLLYQVAGHYTYIFSNVEYECIDPLTNKPTRNKLDLIPIYSRERVEYFDESQKRVANNLKHIQTAASDVILAAKLFADVDEDGSGELEVTEFDKLLRSLGLIMDDERLIEIMDEYDTDGGGTIGIDEFLLFLKRQNIEATCRLKEIEEIPVMALKSDPTKRYVPPDNGVMYISIIDGFAKKEIHRVVSSCDRDYINELASQTGDCIAMTSFGVSGAKVRLDEALNLSETMMQESRSKVDVLVKLLPQSNNTENARQLVNKMLRKNRLEMLQLKRAIGYAIKPILGCPDGFYRLDLSDEMDRFCITKLIEISSTIAEDRKKQSVITPGLLGDLSQTGNWMCFRNECFKGQAIVMTKEFASPLPKSGTLEFDFMSSTRPSYEDLVVSDGKFIKILSELCLLRLSERGTALEMLKASKAYTDEVVTSGKYYNSQSPFYYAVDDKRAREIGDAAGHFGEHLVKRGDIIEHHKPYEEIKVDLTQNRAGDKAWVIASVHDKNNVTYNHPHHSKRIDMAKLLAQQQKLIDDQTRKEKEAEEEKLRSKIRSSVKTKSSTTTTTTTNVEVTSTVSEAVNNALVAYMEGDTSESDDEEFGVSLDNDSNLDIVSNAPPKTDEYGMRYRRMLSSPNVQPEAKASRISDMIVETFEYSNFCCRHLAMMMNLFYSYGHKRSSKFFGTYRVEVIVRLFTRLVDLHNFDLVLKTLTPFECGCIKMRIGILNYWNPLKIDGGIELDISYRDERVVCKCLCTLATNEPGDNLQQLKFRWQRSMDSMPGYQLTEPWLSDVGMPFRGVWNTVYFTTKTGAAYRLRKAMLNLTLISETDLVEESDRSKALENPPSIGEKYVTNNTPLFSTYLAYHNEKK